jgi:hypothetical protein
LNLGPLSDDQGREKLSPILVFKYRKLTVLFI